MLKRTGRRGEGTRANCAEIRLPIRMGKPGNLCFIPRGTDYSWFLREFIKSARAATLLPISLILD